MSMPRDFLMVRHGKSEANIVQKDLKEGEHHPNAKEILARPDWQQKLSAEGERQPLAAGRWLLENIGETALKNAKKYHSPYIRARQTAALLGIPDGEGWLSDDRIVERSWGIYGTLSREEQAQLFPMTTEHKEVNPWYVGMEGGESLSGGVLLRFRNFLDSLHREAADGTAIAVSHGEFMWVARYVLERMTPEAWEALDSDVSQTVRNCSILHYSRVNPENPEHVDDRLRWMRFIYPDAPELSPYGGQWRELEKPKYTTAAQLKDQTDKFENLIVPKNS